MNAIVKDLEKEIITEIMSDMESDIICISDFELQAAKQPITHITIGSSDGNYMIGLWNGDPEEGKYSEEIIASENERINVYKEILELF